MAFLLRSAARARRAFDALPRGSAILAATTFGSYALGLLRDRTFAQTFGASRELDAYNAAFLIPDFLFNVLVASGIAAAVVPIFTDLLRADRAQAQRYVNSILTAAVSAMALTAAFVFLFANQLAAVVAPGFSEADRVLVANLMRVLALSPLLFAASNALGAMLIAERKFFFYGLSPMLYNVGIITGTLLLAPQFGIRGVVFGTIGGAFLHLAARAYDALRSGFRFRPNLAVRTPEFRKTIRLMIPKMFGHPVELATFWGFTAIASGLGAGSIVVLNFARNFQSVPVALIGIAVATAAFPLLARAAAEGSAEHFRVALKQSFWIILLVSAVSAALTYLIREPLVALLLGGKTFGPDAVLRTATMLGVFTLSIPTEALSHLLARAFYATKNTVIPVLATLAGFIVAVGGGWLLAPTLDLFALPLAFAAGSFVKLAILMLLLPRRIRLMERRSP